MWTDISPRKLRVHLRYKNMALKVETQEGAPHIRSNMELRGMLTSRIHLENLLVREMTTPRNYPIVRLVHILIGEERGGSISRSMNLKSLRNPSHPLFMGRLKRGKKQKLGYLS